MSLYLEGLVLYFRSIENLVDLLGQLGLLTRIWHYTIYCGRPNFTNHWASITAKSAKTSTPSFVLSLDFSRAPFAALRNTAPAGRPRTVLSVVGVGGAKVSTMRCKVSLSWRNSEGLEFKWGSLEWTKSRCTYQTLLITKSLMSLLLETYFWE